jgi:TolB-like protein/Tfp pilus assembly protein PilF
MCVFFRHLVTADLHHDDGRRHFRGRISLLQTGFDEPSKNIFVLDRFPVLYFEGGRTFAMSGFFAELRRRKVYRVAVAYIVAGGFIIQIASAMFPAWELPGWSLRLLIVFVLAGFPLALIFAWAFDVTPEGIERTPQIDAQTKGASRHRRRNLILLAVCGLVISIAAGFFVLPRASARKLDKSVAVLPFRNLSSDPENEFFADGIQDDILTALGKISDLKVISRTSVAPYRGKEKNVRDIAKALDVGAIVEGTVRRSGNRVRVNVQLIDARNDSHVWSEDYDRDLTDVFAIQSDLAQRISQELQAKLSPEEEARLRRKPTENTEAYLAFAEARNLHNNWEDFAKLQQAAQLYERAVQLDPNFALALAHWSQLESWLFHEHDLAPERREKARALAGRALELQPDLPEAHLALGFCHYYGSLDYDAALKEFEIAQRGLPNNADVCLSIGAIQRRQSRWNESTANFIRAATLSPNDSWPLQNLSFNYQRERNFQAAIATIDKALTISPKLLGLWGLKGWYVTAERGDFSAYDQAVAVVNAAPSGIEKERYIAEVQLYGLLLQRKYRELLTIAENLNDDVLAHSADGLFAKYMTIGMARLALRDEASARPALLKAKAMAEQQAQQVGAFKEADGHAKLGTALAFLGEKDAAIASAVRATELLPESKDSFYGPVMTEVLAHVYATVGEAEQAIEILEGLLTRPSQVTVPLLKIQPVWDPIRNHPRFVELLKRHDSDK